jgi:hypothetical protein
MRRSMFFSTVWNKSSGLVEHQSSRGVPVAFLLVMSRLQMNEKSFAFSSATVTPSSVIVLAAS